MIPIALTIGGSDPSGGAGVQADLKTFHRFGVYGEAVITLITVQNSVRVSQVETLAPELIAGQIDAVLQDMPPHAAKTGALGSREIVEKMAQLAELFQFPLVVDPVMISKHGTRLLADDAVRALAAKMIPRAYLLMPNLDEASALTGMRVHDRDSMVRAASQLVRMGAANVLVKGGHLEGDPVDILYTREGAVQDFATTRLPAKHTHGTGCTYSSAITAELAKNTPLVTAIRRAKSFVYEAIRSAPGLGEGNGPLNHWAISGDSS